MTNARSIIEQAARKIHVLGRGQTLDADQVNTALSALNNMLGEWSAELGAIYNSTKETFTLSPLTTSYTIGSGGSFNTEKPIAIEAAFITIATLDYPLKMLNAVEYSQIGYKNLSSIPDSLYFEDNTPLGKLYLYPVPASAYTITLYSRKAITEFLDLTTDYTLPTGLENALVWNLAVVLCPEYEKEPSAVVVSQSRKSKSAFVTKVRRNNYPVSDIDFSTKPKGNIYNGWLR